MAVYLLKVADKMLPIGLTIFEAIKKDVKTLETRAYIKRYQGVRKGDTLVFEAMSTGEKVERVVVEVRGPYATIEQIFKCEDFSKIFPGIGTLTGVKKAYYEFPDYEEKIKEYGLVAFEIKRIDSAVINIEKIEAALQIYQRAAQVVV